MDKFYRYFPKIRGGSSLWTENTPASQLLLNETLGNGGSVGTLAGTIETSSVVAGTLTNAGGGIGELAGAIVGETIVQGTLTGKGSLAAVMTTSTTLIPATLQGRGALQGQIEGNSLAIGIMEATGTLSGSIITFSDCYGAIRVHLLPPKKGSRPTIGISINI